MPESNAGVLDGWERLSPSETRRGIQHAAREMGGLVRTTYGPVGVDKMIVRRMGSGRLRGFVTNDGVAILEEFEGETDHPIANHFISMAEAHEDAIGDGTTATTLLASELLTTGVDLIEDGLAPVDVVEGFSIGAQRTLEVWDELAIPLTDTDRPTTRDAFDEPQLARIAHSATTNGRDGSWPLARLSDDLVDAALRAWEPRRDAVNLNYVTVETVPGGDATDSELIPGAILPFEPMVAEHLLPVEGGVLVVHGDLRPRKIRASSVTISGDYEGRVGDLEHETSGIAAAVAEANPAAVFVTGDVTNDIAKALARRDVVCFRNVKESDAERLSRVTGATIRGPVTPSSPASVDEVGDGIVELRERLDDKTWLTVTAPEDADPRSVGLIVRGGTESAADEARRRIRVGLNAVRAAINRPAALPGGGAVDVEAARAVRELAPRFDGREQLAVEAFADVIESLPRTLARNAGYDPIDAITDLRARHDRGERYAGLDAGGRPVDDTVAESDALDAQLVRTSSLTRSVEFAISLLTIDGVMIDTAPPTPPAELD